MSQAFILYEDELPDSKAQLQALHLMVGTLLQSSGFDAPDYDALATKTTQYAAKLFKKPDPAWKSNLQPDFNVRSIERFGPDSFAVLQKLDESNRFVQKSAKSTSI